MHACISFQVGFDMVDAIAEAEGISVNSIHSKALFGKGIQMSKYITIFVRICCYIYSVLITISHMFACACSSNIWKYFFAYDVSINLNSV